jgi:O-antigen ligase
MLSFIGKNKIVFLITIFLSIVYPLILIFSGFDKKVLGLLIGVPLVATSLFNTEILVIWLIISLFTFHGAFGFFLSILFPFPFMVSFLITYHKQNSTEKFKNPIVVPFLIYGISILPSLFNASNIFLCLYAMINLVSMALAAGLLSNFTCTYTQIKHYCITFITLCFFSGVSVIIESMITGGERVFGFTGIVYIDFVNIAILITIILFLYFKKKYIFLIFFLIMFYFTSLLLTQSRNTILSLSVATLFLLIYLFFFSARFSLKKIYLTRDALIILSVLLFLTFLLYLALPQVFERLTEFFKHTSADEDTSLISNTLISRLLIWDTAWKAFLTHPIIGIGVYNFPFDSQMYHRIPTELYIFFVQNLTPHETFLAVLAETGIIGFIGFIIFLSSTIVIAFKAVNSSITEKQKYFSLALLLLQIYIVTSMFMTDAWLWGQCGMLWAVIIGVSIANYKIILKENSILGKRQ